MNPRNCSTRNQRWPCQIKGALQTLISPIKGELKSSGENWFFIAEVDHQGHSVPLIIVSHVDMILLFQRYGKMVLRPTTCSSIRDLKPIKNKVFDVDKWFAFVKNQFRN